MLSTSSVVLSSLFSSRGPGAVRRLGLACLTAGLLLSGCAGNKSEAPRPSDSRTYAFWPPPPSEPRIQYLRSFGSSNDISGREQSGLDKIVFGEESKSAAEINKPYGITSFHGRIYVCDIRNTGLMAMDLVKRQTRLLGTTGQYKLIQPVDVEVAPDGMIYVADSRRGIVVYDANEHYAGTFAREKFEPIGVAVHGDRIYACNRLSQLVEVMSRTDGTLLSTIGSIGDDDGQFRLPLGIAADSDGNVHVVDFMRCRLQKFSPDGKFLKGAGAAADTAGNFVKPKHVTIDKDGNLYVVDAAFQNVQVFNKDYALLSSFGGGGRFEGAMNLPAGVTIFDGDPNLFGQFSHPFFASGTIVLVTNQFGSAKVSAYGVGQLKSGHTGKELAASLIPVPVDTPESKPNPLSGLEGQPLPEDAPATEGAAEGSAPPAGTK
jgi:hypothetical protein